MFIWMIFKAVGCEEREFGACTFWANSPSLIQRSKEHEDDFRTIQRGCMAHFYNTLQVGNITICGSNFCICHS